MMPSRRPRLHPRYAPLLFGGLLSALMVTVVSGAVLLFNQGLVPGFLQRWGLSILTTWPIAFPTVLAVSPLVRRIVQWLTTSGDSSGK